MEWLALAQDLAGDVGDDRVGAHRRQVGDLVGVVDSPDVDLQAGNALALALLLD